MDLALEIERLHLIVHRKGKKGRYCCLHAAVLAQNGLFRVVRRKVVSMYGCFQQDMFSQLAVQSMMAVPAWAASQATAEGQELCPNW